MNHPQKKSKINLDFQLVGQARTLASNIADHMQNFINQHTTDTVERTVCRLLGIDGINDFGVPLPNVVIDNIKKGKGLGLGAANYIGNAILHTNLTPQEIAEGISDKNIDLMKLPMHDLSEINIALSPIVEANLDRIQTNRRKRAEYLQKYPDKSGPFHLCVVPIAPKIFGLFRLHWQPWLLEYQLLDARACRS